MTVKRVIVSNPVMAVGKWSTSAELVRDVVRLGYIKKTDDVLDCTYGEGTFWRAWTPSVLVASDLKPKHSSVKKVDFRKMPWPDDRFDVVVFDPPYKLNGTPSDPDVRYGADDVMSWQARHQLIREGLSECARVLKPKGILLLKCQDQVSSGQVRWQTIEFTNHATQECGLKLEDWLLPMGSRAQPPRSRSDGTPSLQAHARRNYSSLLVFSKKLVRKPKKA